ncbi:hypothetical protein J6590_056737 [Homalodisca vitripennis]|nr:hypothetical protein J6590_056737 [Homalodisca vitripennis]
MPGQDELGEERQQPHCCLLYRHKLVTWAVFSIRDHMFMRCLPWPNLLISVPEEELLYRWYIQQLRHQMKASAGAVCGAESRACSSARLNRPSMCSASTRYLCHRMFNVQHSFSAQWRSRALHSPRPRSLRYRRAQGIIPDVAELIGRTTPNPFPDL